MKILNLYSGIGGNRKLWGNDHEITAIEINPKIAEVYSDNFPRDNLIIADAHEYLLKNYDKFDFIWSSPPCQSHTKLVKFNRHRIRKYPEMQLYQEIILLQNFCSGGKQKWIVENVKPYYKPLINPSFELCRHLWWNNFDVLPFKHKNIKDFINIDDPKILMDWIDIHYDKNIYIGNNHDPCSILRNCVHPDLGLHIFNESQRNGLFNNC